MVERRERGREKGWRMNEKEERNGGGESREK
jgi:hypothetical protein